MPLLKDSPAVTRPYALPIVGHLLDDNGDGVLAQGDTPDLIYVGFDAWKADPGWLRVFAGDGSGEVWAQSEFTWGDSSYSISPIAGPALGDLDGDGSPEVVTVTGQGYPVAFSAAGEVLWVGTEAATHRTSLPSIADLYGDGTAEVVLGGLVFSHEGHLIGQGLEGQGTADGSPDSWGRISVPVDLDGDGIQEIVAGNTIYDPTGAVLARSGAEDGFTAIADLDEDGEPEIITTVWTQGSVYVWERDGTILWRTQAMEKGAGAPTVADFDGDGEPEIGFAGYNSYAVVDTDGALLWASAVTDHSSSHTGSSVFDFDANGSAEVLFADEVSLKVFDGATGAVLHTEEDHDHGTAAEYPIIADVDGDGQSEILLGSASSGDGWMGITVLGSETASWAPTREIWNQHAYSISNIRSDGTVPQDPKDNWTVWNNFRAAAPEEGLSHWRPNLLPGAPSVCTETCSLDEVTFYVQVGNSGLTATRNTATVAFSRSSDGSLIFLDEVSPLPVQGGMTLGPFTLSREHWGEEELLMEIDPYDEIEECVETDNRALLGYWPCED